MVIPSSMIPIIIIFSMQAEVTISKLTEERKSSIRERDVLKEELVNPFQ